MPATPERILIVRLSAIGDVVLATGLIPALRRRWPHAHIAWLTETRTAPLLEGLPGLNEVIVWPRGQWEALWQARRLLPLFQAVRRFRHDLRQRRFDLSIDAQGLLKSAILARMAAAPRRLVVQPREASHWLATEAIRVPGVQTSTATEELSPELRELVRHLGGAPEDFRLALAPPPQAQAQAAAMLVTCGVSGRYAVLAAFTTRAQKHWFDERWVELADHLARAGLTPVLLGGPSDRTHAQAICQPGSRIVDLTGRLSLVESAALVAGAALVVGVDTGLTHMGSAFGIPTVALFGSTRPYLRYHGGPTRVLYHKLPCSPCHRQPSCNGRFDCMRALTVGEVAQHCLAALPVAT